MANDLNQCTFIGRLGRDPELRHTPSGDAVANITIAVGKSWTDKASQEKRESTTWVPVSIFGKTAEIVARYCKKGSQILVTGEFTVRKYTDRDGNEKYATEIRCDRMQLLGSRDDGQQQGGGQQQRPQQAPASRSAMAGDFDDDVPFN